MKTTTKKRKTKRSFSKTTVFKKLVVSLTIVNDKPSLTKRGNLPEGHRYLLLSSFKEKYQEF